MPKIKVKLFKQITELSAKYELEVPEEYCDKPDNVCPMCVDDGVTSYCLIFNSSLKEENYHCERLKSCKNAEVKE